MRRIARCLVVAFVVAGPISDALADEFVLPTLRGSNAFEPGTPNYARWSGAYFGGHAGHTTADLSFAGAAKSLISFILRDTIIESEAHVSEWTTMKDVASSGLTWGGFVGYNVQWEDAIIGVEFNYNRVNLKGASSDSIARSFTTSDDYLYNVDIAAKASLLVRDFTSLRLRGGWAYDWIMPYGFVSAALGRVDYTRTVTLTATAVDVSGDVPPRPNLGLGPITESEDKQNQFALGWGAGLGVDLAMSANLFVRAEFEYLKLFPAGGFEAALTSFRLGGGFKF